jgi:hypothetical protein
VPPGVVHQDPPHRPRRNGVEVSAVAVLETGLVGRPEVDLVDQAGGAQGVIAALATERPPGDPAQLVVDQRVEPVHGRGASSREARAAAR